MPTLIPSLVQHSKIQFACLIFRTTSVGQHAPARRKGWSACKRLHIVTSLHTTPIVSAGLKQHPPINLFSQVTCPQFGRLYAKLVALKRRRPRKFAAQARCCRCHPGTRGKAAYRRDNNEIATAWEFQSVDTLGPTISIFLRMRARFCGCDVSATDIGLLEAKCVSAHACREHLPDVVEQRSYYGRTIHCM